MHHIKKNTNKPTNPSKTDSDTVTACKEVKNTKSGKNLRARACLRIIIFLYFH